LFEGDCNPGCFTSSGHTRHPEEEVRIPEGRMLHRLMVVIDSASIAPLTSTCIHLFL